MKTLNDYTVVVMPDDGTFVAFVPALPGCHAVAYTPEEARAELDGAFEMWREEYAERGQPLPADIRSMIPAAS